MRPGRQRSRVRLPRARSADGPALLGASRRSVRAVARCGLSAFVAAAVGLAGAGSARAAPRIALALEYTVSSPARQCPPAEEFAANVNGKFGYDAIRDDAKNRLVVRMEREGKAFVAHLDVVDRSGESRWPRSIRNIYSCQELMYDAAALVRIGLGPLKWGSKVPPLWLTDEPLFTVGQPAMSATALRFYPLAPLAPAAPLVARGLAPSSEPREGSRVEVEVALGFSLLPTGLPSVGIGGEGMVGVRWRGFAMAAALGGAITPVSGIGERDIPGRTSLWSLAVLPCTVARVIDICAVASASRMAFDVGAPVEFRPQGGVNVGLGGRVASRLKLGEWFHLIGLVDATLPLRLTRFGQVESATVVGPAMDWISPPLRITLGVAIGATIVR